MASARRARRGARIDERHEEAAAERGSRIMWSGTISFGLVSIPVNLQAGVRPTHVSLRMLAPGGTPLIRRYACSADGEELSPEQIVRGYELEPDRFVVVEDEELEALAPDKSRDIDLRRFVDLTEIDPVFFDHPYFLTAAGGSTKAYRLLVQTMEATGRAGIATFVMRGKEYLVAILAEHGLLRAETLRFSEEIRRADDVGLPATTKISAAERTRIDKAIASLAANGIDPAELIDERDRRLIELVTKKDREDRDVITSAAPPEPEDAAVVDLMERLKRSLRAHPAAKRPGKRARRAA